MKTKTSCRCCWQFCTGSRHNTIFPWYTNSKCIGKTCNYSKKNLIISVFQKQIFTQITCTFISFKKYKLFHCLVWKCFCSWINGFDLTFCLFYFQGRDSGLREGWSAYNAISSHDATGQLWGSFFDMTTVNKSIDMNDTEVWGEACVWLLFIRTWEGKKTTLSVKVFLSEMRIQGFPVNRN